MDFLSRRPSRLQRPTTSRLDLLAHKSKWLRDIINEGGQIVDLGPAPTSPHFPLPSSVFRLQESLEVAGYANHFTRLEYFDQGNLHLDKGDYVPPMTRARPGEPPSIDSAKLEHAKVTLVSNQILNSPIFAELNKLDYFDLLTDDGYLQFTDAPFNGLLSDLLEDVTMLGSVCDKETQTRIGPVQQILRLCKFRFYAKVELEAVCRRLNETRIESHGSDARLVGLEKSFLSKSMSPQEYWELMLKLYRKHAESKTGPLNEMLSGRRQIPPPSNASSCEAWITYSLYWQESEFPVALELVLASADFANVQEPNAEEIAWTFVKLRKRGWLLESGTSYGLTRKGRSVVDEIVQGRSYPDGIKLIEGWVLGHNS